MLLSVDLICELIFSINQGVRLMRWRIVHGKLLILSKKAFIPVSSALWNNETRNKLYEIRLNLKESLCTTTQSLYRKQETVMTRLRIGHTWITHSYLLQKEDQPFCHACDNPFTVKHILVECSDFTYIRNKYYTTTDVHTLFREVNSSKITEYLKEINLFDKI